MGRVEDEEGKITVGEGEWVEGATQEEIDELTKPHEPTELDLIHAQGRYSCGVDTRGVQMILRLITYLIGG